VQAALASQRSYQRQKVTLHGQVISNEAVTAGADSNFSTINLLPQDDVVRAIVRITNNSAGHPLSLDINLANQTSALGGPWSTIPVEIDVTAYATQFSATDNRFFANLTNGGGTSTTVDFQLSVEVLR
jgi:hypothetical protein